MPGGPWPWNLPVLFRVIGRAQSSLPWATGSPSSGRVHLSANELKPGTRSVGSLGKPGEGPRPAGRTWGHLGRLTGQPRGTPASTSKFNGRRGLWQDSISHKLYANEHLLPSLSLFLPSKIPKESIPQGGVKIVIENCVNLEPLAPSVPEQRGNRTDGEQCATCAHAYYARIMRVPVALDV